LILCHATCFTQLPYICRKVGSRRIGHTPTIAFCQYIGNSADDTTQPPYAQPQEEEEMEIRNASVLITGGSRGLGRALGKALAREGARVVLVARGAEELNTAVDEIRNEGGEAYGIAADIGDKNAIYPIAGEAAALAGPIDILIQNASTLGPVPLRLLLDTDCEDLQRVWDVNLAGPFRLAKVIVGSMALRGRGLMISITSDAAIEAYAGWGAYSITKAALDHLTRIFAAELCDTGVRFFSIDPGDMDTQMHADAVPNADPATIGKPDDIAPRILGIIREAEHFPNGARLAPTEVGALK
jgi:NAD(P)-dependent dehydrogenase (short-subunit alcohol dehydrogenase family)